MKDPQQTIREIEQVWGESREALSESWQALFGAEWTFADTGNSEQSLIEQAELFEQPGLFLPVTDGELAAFLLIPGGPTLENWDASRLEEEKELLAALREKFHNVLLASYEKSVAEIKWSANLAEEVRGADLSDDLTVIPLDTENSSQERQQFFLLISVPPTEEAGHSGEEETKAEAFEPDEATDVEPQRASDDEEIPAGHSSGPSDELRSRVRRVMPLTVKVSVRVAEKKIDLGQLINLCPGTLIMFQKSCDDLLDLYVNNRLYAKGEAVKIGEKFGLKVNEVGAKKERQPGVFSL